MLGQDAGRPARGRGGRAGSGGRDLQERAPKDDHHQNQKSESDLGDAANECILQMNRFGISDDVYSQVRPHPRCTGVVGETHVCFFDVPFVWGG
jgi:hypothetical protein